MVVWTVGHSTHAWADWLSLLRAHRIACVADVRRVPRSRRQPHFSTDALAAALPPEGVAYHHLARLGGWRSSRRESPNGAWTNASFRAYADYALTDEFAQGLEELQALAAERPTVMVCSEALWWRCHRRLVADRLVATGAEVVHIGADGRTSAHALPAFASVRDDGRVVYPG